MPANAQVYAGSWPASTPDLGTLDLSYVKPIVDAQFYWSSLQLPLGSVEVWRDRVTGARLTSPGGSQVPVVYTNVRKVVRFDGVNDRMDAPLPVDGPCTFVIVGRFANVGANQYLVTGGSTGGSFNLYQGSNGNFAFFAGKTLSSTKPNDSNNHVFLVVSDGENSVLSIDGQEWAGDAGVSNATGVRLAASASAYFAGDVQAVVLLPYAAGVARRASLVAQLKSQYRIG